MYTGPLKDFLDAVQVMKAPRVLELGTKRSQPDRSTKHTVFVPNASEYLGTDIETGEDVDFVADIHQISKVIGSNKFDAIISCSTFEHFKYPHLAAHEVMKILRVGGLLFIQTHQTFPIHAYPYDFFRFSREALAGLFGTKMGFHVISVDYEFPAKIYSDDDPQSHIHSAYLNTRLFGRKSAPTPMKYIYEFD